MTGPLIRILLRYLSGVLIAKGIFADGDTSLLEAPELVNGLEMIAGMAIAAGTEYWYKLADKRGWRK